MNDAIKLKDVEGLKESVSLFAYMNAYSSGQLFPSDFFSSAELEVKATEYYFHSGDKFLTRLARYWLEASADLASFFAFIAKSAVAHYGVNWKAIVEAYFNTSYAPLENYSMTEKRTPDLEETTKVETDFKTTQTNSAEAYGFNSSDPVGTNGTESVTSGTRVNNIQDVTKSNTGTDTTTRSGNIGVTTSQQMLQSELEVRKFDFWESVFNDLDRILCQLVY